MPKIPELQESGSETTSHEPRSGAPCPSAGAQEPPCPSAGAQEPPRPTAGAQEPPCPSAGAQESPLAA